MTAREPLLSPAELALWHAWKRAGEAVMTRVGRDLTAATGLSGADFGVLSRLVDLGDGGALRHRDLAQSMGWDKSRLSHHVSRMVERGLVARRAGEGAEVRVAILAPGRRALDRARPVHAQAVRRRLLARLDGRERKLLRALLERLAADDQDDDDDASDVSE